MTKPMREKSSSTARRSVKETAKGNGASGADRPRSQEAELRRANRALRTISSCNQAMIHATKETELLEEVCRVIVEEGGYRLAWVGYAENDERNTVRPVACAGFEAGYLKKVNITWADEPRGRGPTGTAIRTRQPAVCRDVHVDPKFEPWREDAKKRGYASSLVVPMLDKDAVLGAVSIYATEPDAFDPEEVKLLQELADDLVFGLISLRAQAMHQQSVAALRVAVADAKRFQEALNQVSSYVYIKDAQSRYVYANRPTLKLFGCNAEELVGRGDAHFFPPDTVKVLRELDLRALRGEQTAREITVADPNGSRRVYWELKTPLQLETEGVPAPGLLGISTDITSLKQSEAEALQNERELRQAQRIAHIGSWQLNLLSNRVSLSEELNRMLGLDPTQPPLGYPEFQKQFTPGSWQRLSQAIDQTRTAGVPYELELEMIRPDGQQGWMLARGEAQLDPSGGIIGIRGVAQDITERKQAEEALRKEQTLFASLVGTIPDHIYFKDRQSRFVRINDLMARDSGMRDPAEAIGKTDFDIFGEEHARQAYADEQRVMETGEPIIGLEEKETWADGRVTWVSSTKMPLHDAEGRITGLVGISRDITQRKMLEKQFLQSQKMEAFGQLAGGVAHDFNNILGVMLMQLNLLQMEKGLSGTVVSGLAELERHAMRGAGLTRQLLMFSRRQEMEPRTLDLNHLLDDISKMLRRVLGEHIAFELKKSTVPLWIEADTGMIEQVLMNLCINARDAMHHGGQLTIETRPVECRSPVAKAMGHYACLAVTDNGCGMDEATKARIFEPFFTTKPAGMGTGIGLATVYGIVQQHRGWVEVDSAPDRGSTFRVLFPLKEQQSKEEEETDHHEVPGGHESILLVEDEAALRMSMTASLQHAGYRVREAANGPEALQHWEEGGHEFDLLITDYLMPGGVTGVQLATQLVRARESLKVIVMSGYIPGSRDSAAPWKQKHTRLTKPFEAKLLLKTVRQCLDAKPAS